MLAPHGGRFHAGTNAFANQRRFQFCHGRDNREHGPAHWAGCVNLILNADKSYAEVIEFFKICQKVARGTGKSVEFPHKYAIELKITNAAHQCI